MLLSAGGETVNPVELQLLRDLQAAAARAANGLDPSSPWAEAAASVSGELSELLPRPSLQLVQPVRRLPLRRLESLQPVP